MPQGKRYGKPTIREYGAVGELTLADDKCDPGSDEYEDSVPITGSIQDCTAN